ARTYRVEYTRKDDPWPISSSTGWAADPEDKKSPAGHAGRGPFVLRPIWETLGSAVTASRSQGPREENPRPTGARPCPSSPHRAATSAGSPRKAGRRSEHRSSVRRITPPPPDWAGAKPPS